MDNTTQRPASLDSAAVKFDGPARSAVGICCVNSAVMLRFADQGEVNTKEKRAAILKANNGQAQLLIEAANIADEMLAALQMMIDSHGGLLVSPAAKAACAAIAKAKGEA